MKHVRQKPHSLHVVVAIGLPYKELYEMSNTKRYNDIQPLEKAIPLLSSLFVRPIKLKNWRQNHEKEFLPDLEAESSVNTLL